MKCLVSGATGFIGRQLCKRLEAEGVDFVALSATGGTLPGGRSTIAVDLATHGVEPGLLAGVDVVFHLAGIAHQRAEPELYERVNHRATVDLAAKAAAAGVRCFVFLSSVKAMGAPRGNEVRTEACCAMPRDAYGLSKWQAEEDLQGAYTGGDMSVLILRPALVYGAGATGNLQLLARAVRAGVPRPPAFGGRSMIAREDLVELLIRLAEQPPPGVHTWIVCDGRAYSARKIHDLMRVALGRKPALAWLPAWAWRLACNLRDLWAKPVDGSTFGKIFGTELYSSTALEQALDWRPRLELADAIGEIMAPESLRPGEVR